MNHKITHYTALIMVGITLSACGHTQADRAISGAGLGAATGLVTGAAIGGAAGTGMLVGAGVGAAIGGLSDESKINLGRPWWR
jgi:osmotically inducible lipoprotein OsmB